jgi:hypothetical protein
VTDQTQGLTIGLEMARRLTRRPTPNSGPAPSLKSLHRRGGRTGPNRSEEVARRLATTKMASTRCSGKAARHPHYVLARIGEHQVLPACL